VADADPRLWDELPEGLGDMEDSLDAVVDVVDLSATRQFTQDGLADDFLGEWTHEGAHREPPRRRIVDQRQLPNIHQRHAERPRDRGCGHAENVDAGPKVLQRLLLLHPEPLLLVDNHEAELVELDGLTQKRMGADDDIDLASLEPPEDVSSLAGRAEPV